MRTVTRRSANHTLHLILTVLTVGLWAPVWVVMAMIGRREVTTYSEAQAVQGAWGHWREPAPVPLDRLRDELGYQWNPYSQRWEQTGYGGR